MTDIPTTRRMARLTSKGGALQVELCEGPVPEMGPRDVLVRIEAASLNYRDLMVLRGQYPLPARDGLVPLSDGAGTVAAIGPQATRWRVGDRVAPLFFRGWVDGPFRAAYAASGLGAGEVEGVLADYVAVPEDALAKLPGHLTAEEAATLPCAAVTAWHALMARGGLKAGDTVLVQGTGGVALFGLQFAAKAGAKVIVTSSSDSKLERARGLGAWATVNSRAQPDWDAEVRRLTGGEGASHILELGGADTFARSLACVAAGGTIAQIGVLSGFGAYPNLAPLMFANADVAGILVGSGEHFASMAAFIAHHRLKPVVDKVLPFTETRAAYDHLAAAGHFGKVVISLTH